MKVYLTLAIALLSFASIAAPPQDADDQYLKILALIEQGDSFSKVGQAAPAVKKYQDAQRALLNFQHTFPIWNPNVVAFRSTYLANKVAALTGGAPGAGANVGSNTASASPVKLLEAGAEPRKALRLHPKQGAKQTVALAMKMAVDIKAGEMQVPGMKLPEMNMTMEVTVKNVSADGDANYEVTITEADVGDTTEVLRQIAEALKSSMASVKGVKGTGTMSSRGINKKTDLSIPEGADPQTKQAMEQLKESFSKISVPLPEQPVGVGAKWELKMPLKSQGLTMEQTAMYELSEVEGDHLTTKATITQTAENQKMENPAMPSLKLDVTKMTANGTGEVSSDLGQLLPTNAASELHSEFAMSMNMGGEKQSMTMKMDMNVRLEGK